MLITRNVFGLLIFTILASCTSENKPTSFPMPPGATEVRNTVLLADSAYQTDFILHATYPSTLAFAHYSKVIGMPWRYCVWSGKEWQSYGDHNEGRIRSIHQQLHIWVNPEAKRTLTLALRYTSAGSRIGEPDNDMQSVILVEQMSTDVKQAINDLQLKCPPEVNAML